MSSLPMPDAGSLRLIGLIVLGAIVALVLAIRYQSHEPRSSRGGSLGWGDGPDGGGCGDGGGGGD